MKIYIASKAAHRPRWVKLRRKGAPFNSRWIDIPEEMPDENINFPLLWSWCLEDVQKCDILVAVVDPSERLKGVLIEIGAALAFGKRVIVLGDPGRENGTWVNHPNIEWQKHQTIEGCLLELGV